MNKNEREKKILYEWGLQNKEEYRFNGIDREKESYFVKRDEDVGSYIREYGFETLPELMRELDVLWGEDEVMSRIKRVVSIAALKNKPTKAIQEEVMMDNLDKKSRETEDKLPAFIYNF